MQKPSSLSPFVAASLLLLGTLAAQRGPLPGMPLVPPPVPHPALAGQPLMNGNGEMAKAMLAAVTVRDAEQPPKPDPATSGVKVSGAALKRAVAKVKKMSWHESFRECELNARSTGKPILYLQTLGDLTGFA